MIHLDTSFLVLSLSPGTAEEAALLEWLATDEDVALSSMAWAEFLCGPVGPDAVALARSMLAAPVAMGGREAELAAELFNATGRRRGSLVDCLVASTAMRAGARLATRNPRDFRPFVKAGLELVP